MVLVLTALAGVLAFFPTPSLAATCTVEPAGPTAGNYLSVSEALSAGGCDAPGSVIEISCPAPGCSDFDVKIDGLTDITVRSLESSGDGPVTLSATPAGAATGPAVKVTGSTGIVFDGISDYVSTKTAVEVEDSDVTFMGPTVSGIQRYGDLDGIKGMEAKGLSDVLLKWMGSSGGRIGLRLVSTDSGSPTVTAKGVALLDNIQAVEVFGASGGCGTTFLPAALKFRSDFETAWLNYVMGNVEGFRLRGWSELLMDHTVLASNIYQLPPNGGNPELFDVRGASRLKVRNSLLYDNDTIPGLSGRWPGPPTGAPAGTILQHESCGKSSFQASSVINNAADLVFNMGGSGKLELDHTLVSGTWGKVISMSSYYVSHGNTCPPITTIATNFRGNNIDADPGVCTPPSPGLDTTWKPGVTVSPNTPRTLTGYPDVPAPWTDLYLINKREPIPYALPSNLYMGRDWSVNGINPDKKRLDVGYHNPM